jgi:two-component system response regulator BaeR
MTKPHILVVEDELRLARLQRDYLVQAGYTVEILNEGSGAVSRILQDPPALVVLDLMLPGEDGLSICRRVRERSEVPVIMVTARVDELDRLLGLELGADDYLCKPFSPRELVLRVNAILRRTRDTQDRGDEPVLRYRGLVLDAERFVCELLERPLELTPVEFRLLSALLEHPGKVFSRAQLMTVAYADHRVVSDRTIDSHMRNLRHKLEPREGRIEVPQIRSVYGVGYACE